MSDYFGALIRSSGLRIGNAPVAIAAPPAAAAQDLIEISDERQRPSIDAARSTASRDERPIASAAPAIAPLESPSDPGLPVARRAAGEPRAPTREIAVPAPSRDVPSAPVAPRTNRSHATGAASERPAVDPVRLALQWIAADPGAQAIPPEHAVPTAPTAQHFQAPPAAVEPEVIAAPAVTRERVVPAVDQPRARVIAGEPAVRAIALPTAARDAERSAPAPRPGRMSEPAAEIVEISIGAINLHVEAPAPRTVVQAPSAREPKPSRQRAERSGLHRRYLRQF